MQNNIIGKKSIHSLALMESFQRAMIEGIKGFCFRKSFKEMCYVQMFLMHVFRFNVEFKRKIKIKEMVV